MGSIPALDRIVAIPRQRRARRVGPFNEHFMTPTNQVGFANFVMASIDG